MRHEATTIRAPGSARQRLVLLVLGVALGLPAPTSRAEDLDDFASCLATSGAVF